MSNYSVRLPDGRVGEVPMPVELTFKRGLTIEQAKAATLKYVTKWVATALEPVIEPRPAWREIVRGETGQIDAMIDHPADPPAAETAAELGRQAAELYVSEVDWS